MIQVLYRWFTAHIRICRNLEFLAKQALTYICWLVWCMYWFLFVLTSVLVVIECLLLFSFPNCPCFTWKWSDLSNSSRKGPAFVEKVKDYKNPERYPTLPEFKCFPYFAVLIKNILREMLICQVLNSFNLLRYWWEFKQVACMLYARPYGSAGR